MVKFGAELSLKDNMSASLKKALNEQKKFSKQIKDTANRVKELGKQKIAPIIKVKDTATKVINKVKSGLKAVGKFVATPFVKIKDGATKALNKIKDTLSKISKPIKIGLGIVGAGAGALLGGSISEGAKLQQSKGGVETLYKGKEGDGGAVDTVIANANKAYKTAGLSANAYMETVTSFSASLLSSLGGDTAKSATIADMAIIDMADNANKFGTDMESIQTAYQGFAKQNYTMLDNLKLGYGGTKEEMQRLLKDAQKISGVKYDIKNLSDVYSAIHVVQEKLGVAGATADEAEKTFTGSFSAMKASAQNVLGALATGGNIEAPMQELAESASTFFFNNFVPMVGNIFKALPTAIGTFIKTGLPKLKEAGGNMITSLKDGLTSMLPAEMGGAVGGIFDTIGKYVQDFQGLLSSVMPSIQGIFVSVAPVIGTLVSTLAQVFTSAFPLIQNVMSIFQTVVQGVAPIVSTIMQDMGAKLGEVVGFVGSHMDGIKQAFEMAMPVVSSILETAWGIISPILDMFISLWKLLWSVLNKVLPPIMDIFKKLWDFLKPIFDGIGSGLKWIADGVGKFVGWATGEGDEGSGHAFGLGRVPYNNYPARLHEGEKVLTKTQANQYDRAMSTRGVTVGITPTTPTAGGTGGGSNVTIEKLADTVVIEKDADVDKVVEAMVTKFKKLVPNMA